MPEDPLIMLTKRFAKPTENPEDLTQMAAKEQLQFYLAFDIGSVYYGMKALSIVTLEDKVLMMGLQGKRSDQLVDAVRGINAPLGLDVGMQPVDKYLAEGRRKRELVAAQRSQQ